jgi:hypothetical protein
VRSVRQSAPGALRTLIGYAQPFDSATRLIEEIAMRNAVPGVVLSVLVLASSVIVSNRNTVSAQTDPHSGTWVLNTAKSKYTPGPAPKEQTSVYTVTAQGVTVSTKGISADGKPTSTDFSANFDGKDYPVKGNPDWDAISVRRVDSHTLEFARKRAGKPVQTATSVVSKDGKIRTINTTGVNAAGQKITTFGIYDRK